MTKIKICGLSRMQDIEIVNEVLPDDIGFVFAESRRRVSHRQAQEMKSALDKRILAVGVFVNAAPDEIIQLCRTNCIDIIQLHGDEDLAYITALKKRVPNPIIKAVRVQSASQILAAQALPCDYLLLDTYQKDAYGGSGKSFDRSLIPKLEKPFFLAGGLNSGNIKTAITDCHPYCLDVSSGAEKDGVKDREKIKEIIRIVRGEV
jgi:phosphoribosylanthranilate isomerase